MANRIGLRLATQIVLTFYISSALSARAIIKEGANETLGSACSAATDKPVGVVSEYAAANTWAKVITKGDAYVLAGGVIGYNDWVILDSTGQKVVSIEQSPNTSLAEYWVLGRAKSVATSDGDIVVIDVDIQKIANPNKVEYHIIALNDVEPPEPVEGNVGDLAATTNIDIFEAPVAGRVVSFEVAVTTTISQSDTNFWEFNLVNESNDGTGTDDILDNTGDANTTKSTGGTGITADILQSLALNASNVALTAGDVLRLGMTKNASAADLKGLYYKLVFATDADTYIVHISEFAGTVASFKITNTNAVSASDSDYYEFNLINKSNDASGAADVLDNTSDANTTKSTGGSAISAFIERNFAIDTANDDLVAGDVLLLQVTPTGDPTKLNGAVAKIGVLRS